MLQKFVTGLACGAVVLGLAGAEPANAARLYYITFVDATNPANDTGVMFTTGQIVTVKAKGYATISNVQPAPFMLTAQSYPAGYVSPQGATIFSGANTDPDCATGSLIGTIAGSGTYHCLGKSAGFTADGNGDLILLINDQPGQFSDNLGGFEVLTEEP